MQKVAKLGGDQGLAGLLKSHLIVLVMNKEAWYRFRSISIRE